MTINVNFALNRVLDYYKNKSVHENYKRTLEVKKFSKTILTGKDQKDLLVSYKNRESQEAKDQRVHITNSITDFASSQIYKVFNKINRLETHKDLIIDNDNDRGALNDSIANFTDRGLEGYLNKIKVYYTFYDPNAWLLIERYKDQDNRFYPYVIKSESVLDYMDTHGVVDYIFFRGKENELYFYGAGFCCHFVEVRNKKDNIPEGYMPLDGAQGLYYMSFENNSKEVPVMRLGEFPDPVTDMRTFISPIFLAESIYRELINDKSCFDLTKNLNVFLQKYVFAPRCDYQTEDGLFCENGLLMGSDLEEPGTCPKCKGKGLLVHTTEQEAIFLEIPDQKEDMIDLQSLAHYVNLPEWLPKWLLELVDKSVKRVYEATFNSEVYDRVQVAKTATEKLLDFEQIYDTLEIVTSNFTHLYNKTVKLISDYLDLDGVTSIFTFPKDFQLESTNQLLAKLKLAKEANAAISIIKAIEDQILRKLYLGNDLQYLKEKSYKNHLPFSDKSDGMISLILTSRSSNDLDRILYENFARIKNEVDNETNGDFYLYSFSVQRETLLNKAKEIVEEKKETEINRLPYEI